MKWIIRLVVVALLVVVARDVRDRQAQIAAVAEELDGRPTALRGAEMNLDDGERRLEDAAARLATLDARVTAVEEQYPDGIPADEYAAYEALVAERNEAAEAHNDLVDRQRVRMGDYREQVDRHNAGVHEANALAAQATPWAIAQHVWARVTGAAAE